MSNTNERRLWIHHPGDGDVLIYIVRLNRDHLYAVFYEDAYELEPWQSGLEVFTAEEIKQKFNIEL